MTDARYAKLDATGASPSPQEMHEGWHYCPSMDGLLMQLGDACCQCEPLKPVAMARRIQDRSAPMVMWVIGQLF